MILVRHEPVSALGMSAMELMAVSASPALLDPVGPKPGDRVKLAVRQQNDQLVLIRIEKLPWVSARARGSARSARPPRSRHRRGSSRTPAFPASQWGPRRA